MQKLQDPSPITSSIHLWVTLNPDFLHTDAEVVMDGAQATHLAVSQCSSCKGHHVARQIAFHTVGGTFCNKIKF